MIFPINLTNWLVKYEIFYIKIKNYWNCISKLQHQIDLLYYTISKLKREKNLDKLTS